MPNKTHKSSNSAPSDTKAFEDVLIKMLSTPPQPKTSSANKKPSKPKTEKAKK